MSSREERLHEIHKKIDRLERIQDQLKAAGYKGGYAWRRTVDQIDQLTVQSGMLSSFYVPGDRDTKALHIAQSPKRLKRPMGGY